MKKLFTLFITLIICRGLCSCSRPQPHTTLPQVPAEMFALEEIGPHGYRELEQKVAAFTVADFFHRDRIAMFEKRGIALTVENIRLNDCNTISFELVLTKKDGSRLKLPATGMLMYQYLPMNKTYINRLHVLWGNLGIYDSQIVFANINTMSLWDVTTLKKSAMQPELSFITEGNFCFILDAIKDNAGYTISYYSRHESGFAFLSSNGRFIKTQLLGQGSRFGAEKVMESMNYNSNIYVSSQMHTFYCDEDRKQLFISYEYSFGYDGPDYYMYDFEKGMFQSSYQMAHYSMPDYDFYMYGIISYDASIDRTRDTTFIANRKKNGTTVDNVIFKADIDPTDFGSDKITGWNHNTYIDISSDMNNFTLGCYKTNTLMDIDFSAGSADVYTVARMPEMLGIDNSPINGHLIYRAWDGAVSPLVVRITSGNCRLNHLADVTGSWGVDWLAGFADGENIYILTKDSYTVYRWYGDTNWTQTVYVRGDYNINQDTVKKLNSIYT